MHGQATGIHPAELWGGARPAVDLDVTVIADVRHLPLLRETARSFAIKRGARRPDDVRLAVGEACTNVIQHAYDPRTPGELHLHGSLDGHWVIFTVEDRGPGLHPEPLAGRGGMGLPIIAQVADHYTVSDAESGGTRVHMAFATAWGAHA